MSDIDYDAVADAAGYDYAMDCLKERMEELRKDAERYRWIRARAVTENTEFSEYSFDAQIDKAIQDEAK